MAAVDAFTSGQTLQEIVASCERLADNPGLNLDPGTNAEPVTGALRNAPAYKWLLDLMRELATLHDWPFFQTAKTLTLPSGASSVSLPPEYWRMSGEIPMWILTGSGNAGTLGARRPVQLLDRETFFAGFPTTSTASLGIPNYCYIDRINGSIFLRPIPDQTYLAEFHFFQIPKGTTANFSGTTAQGVTNASITDVPWFPFHNYLEKALLVKYYIDQDDNRAQEAEAQRQALWTQIRTANFDLREGGLAANLLLLDPQVFPVPPNL